MPVADCTVERWRRPALRRKASRRVTSASAVSTAAAAPTVGAERRFAGERAGRRGEDEARGETDEQEVHERERMRPLLDEAQARVDHRRAEPEQQRDRDGGQRQHDLRPWRRPAEANGASHQRTTTPMNAGSTITSRESHELRHIAAARQARSGRPRCRNEAPRPITQQCRGEQEQARREARRRRQAAERGERERDDEALRGAGDGREDDRPRTPDSSPLAAARRDRGVRAPGRRPRRSTRRGRYWLAGLVSHSGISE